MKLTGYICSVITLLFVLSNLYADRFGLNDPEYDYGGYSSGGVYPIGFLMAVACVVASFYYLSKIINEYKDRKARGERAKRPEDAFEWVISVVFLLFVAGFLSVPLLLIVKWVIGSWLVQEYWLWVYLPVLAAISYLNLA